MIEILDAPENVLAMSAKGKITDDDYESVIIPAIEGMLQEHEKIRALYFMGPEFEGMKGGAMWDDTKVGMKHFRHFEKIAVVADKKWVRRSIKAFGFLFPGDVKLFRAAELDEAMAWVAAEHD